MRISVVFAALLVLAPGLVLADTITVQTRPGYPSRGSGYSAFELKLVRPVAGQTTAPGPIEAAFREVESAVAEAAITDKWALLVPDAGSLEIRAEIGGRTITLASCHLHFESDPRLVVTARGVESLAGRSRTDVIDAQPLAFQRGRKAFERSVSAIMQYVQTRGAVFP